MYRIRDFLSKDVKDIKGKHIGTVTDLVLDINQNKVIGFEINCTSFTQSCFTIPFESVLYFNKYLITEKNSINSRVPFQSIRSMDIVDICGNILGVIEDIIIDTKSLDIKGFISSMGFIKNYIFGKNIFLSMDLIIGDDSILFTKKNGNFSMISTLHSIYFEAGSYEK